MNFALKNKILILLVSYFRYIMIGLVVVLLFISFYFFLVPKFNEIQKQGGLDYDTKVSTLNVKQKDLNNLKNLQQKLEQVTDTEKRQLAVILPDQKQLPDIFLQMQKLALDNGLKITQISVADSEKTAVAGVKNSATLPASKSSLIGSIGISISVEGDNTYPALKLFLDSVEDNMRLVDINSFNYSPSQGQAAYSVNMKTYYMDNGGIAN